LSKDFFDLFTLENETNFPTAKIAELTIFPVAKVKCLTDLEESNSEKESINEKLFIKKKLGEKVKFKQILIKLNLASGSRESIKFLRSLTKIHPKNDIFTT
jgi:hypothetical protein